MNHSFRRSPLSLAGAVLLALVVTFAVHGKLSSVVSPAMPADGSRASFGQWVAETFPTPEAGFARRASNAAKSP